MYIRSGCPGTTYYASNALFFQFIKQSQPQDITITGVVLGYTDNRNGTAII